MAACGSGALRAPDFEGRCIACFEGAALRAARIQDGDYGLPCRRRLRVKDVTAAARVG